MDKYIGFFDRCVPISNDDVDDNDDCDDGDYLNQQTRCRSGENPTSDEDYGSLLHELTSDQIDTSIATYLAFADSRPASPENVVCIDKYADRSELDPLLSPCATVNITPASIRTTINNAPCIKRMDKVDKPTRKEKEIHDSNKRDLHQKETRSKCKRRMCRVDGCPRMVKSQGVCQRHGAKTKFCRVQSCGKQAQGNFNGMCKAHFKMCCQNEPLDLITPPEKSGQNPRFNHYIGNLLPEALRTCDSTPPIVQPSPQQVDCSLAIITDYYSNDNYSKIQNDHNDQHQQRQPPMNSEQMLTYDRTDNRQAVVFTPMRNNAVTSHHRMENRQPVEFFPVGNSAASSPSPFYANPQLSYNTPRRPYHESSHSSPIALSHCVPLNAVPIDHWNSYNYQNNDFINHSVPPRASQQQFFQQPNQNNNFINHLVPPRASPQQYFQQPNHSRNNNATHGGWMPSFNPVEATLNPSITYFDHTNMMVPTMVSSSAIGNDSCAVVSVLDTTASSDPLSNNQTTTTPDRRYSYETINSIPSTPLQDRSFKDSKYDFDDDLAHWTP